MGELATGARGGRDAEAGAVLAAAPPRSSHARATGHSHRATSQSDRGRTPGGPRFPGGLVRLVAGRERPTALAHGSLDALPSVAGESGLRRRSPAPAPSGERRRRPVPPPEPLSRPSHLGSDEQRRRTDGSGLPAPLRPALQTPYDDRSRR